MPAGFEKYPTGSSGSTMYIDFRTSRILPGEYSVGPGSGSVSVSGVDGKIFAYFACKSEQRDITISGHTVSWTNHTGNDTLIIGVCGL